MTAPLPGLPATIQIHAIDAAGNDLAPAQIPSTTVGTSKKTGMTLVRAELWTSGDASQGYFNAELHLFLRVQ